MARALDDKNKSEIYNSLVSEVDATSPYILVAVNYQPERTTMPDAGHYYDFIRLIDVISAALPTGWNILFKEHPHVFFTK